MTNKNPLKRFWGKKLWPLISGHQNTENKKKILFDSLKKLDGIKLSAICENMSKL